MFRWLAFLAILVSAATAEAQTLQIDSMRVVKAGLMKTESKPKTTDRKDLSTGTEVNYDENPRVYRETDEIKPVKTTIFGIEAKLNGSPKGANAHLRVVWLYPEPGIKNPNGGEVKVRDEYEANMKIGSTGSYYWTINEESYTNVPGTWTIEIWQDQRRLLKHEFEVVVK